MNLTFTCWCGVNHKYESKIAKDHIKRAGQVPRFIDGDESRARIMQDYLDEGTS